MSATDVMSVLWWLFWFNMFTFVLKIWRFYKKKNTLKEGFNVTLTVEEDYC